MTFAMRRGLVIALLVLVGIAFADTGPKGRRTLPDYRYFRALSNMAQVIIRGKKYPVVGRVCMDQIMVNLEWDSAYNGDEVVLLGEGGRETIACEDLAEWAGTIPYEILTNINTRVPRVYY